MPSIDENDISKVSSQFDPPTLEAIINKMPRTNKATGSERIGRRNFERKKDKKKNNKKRNK